MIICTVLFTSVLVSTFVIVLTTSCLLPRAPAVIDGSLTSFGDLDVRQSPLRTSKPTLTDHLVAARSSVFPASSVEPYYDVFVSSVKTNVGRIRMRHVKGTGTDYQWITLLQYIVGDFVAASATVEDTSSFNIYEEELGALDWEYADVPVRLLFFDGDDVPKVDIGGYDTYILTSHQEVLEARKTNPGRLVLGKQATRTKGRVLYASMDKSSVSLCVGGTMTSVCMYHATISVVALSGKTGGIRSVYENLREMILNPKGSETLSKEFLSCFQIIWESIPGKNTAVMTCSMNPSARMFSTKGDGVVVVP